MMPRRVTRPLALVTAAAIGFTSCRPAAAPPPPAPPPPVSAKIDAALAGLRNLGRLPPSQGSPAAPPPRPADPDEPLPPVPTAPLPRDVTADSYEAFCVLFYARTGKTWDDYRADLAGVRAAFLKATTEKHDPPDFAPVRAALDGLRVDEARHSAAQKAAVADTTARLGEYQTALATVATLLKGATEKVLPDQLAATTALEAAVEAIKHKKLGRAAIRAHLEAAFDEKTGSVGGPLARLGKSRDDMNAALVGLRASVEAVKPAWDRLDASFAALQALFPNEPEINRAIPEFKKENQKWWETTEVRIAALFDPLLLLVVILFSLFGPKGGGGSGEGGGGQGGGRGSTTGGTTGPGTMPPGGTGTMPPGGGTTPQPGTGKGPDQGPDGGPDGKTKDDVKPLPPGSEPLNVKTPPDGRYLLRPYRLHGEAYLNVTDRENLTVSFTFPFSVHRYAGFDRVEAARAKGALELTEIDVTRPFPATLTAKADGAEVKIQWAEKDKDPRLLERPTGVEFTPSAAPVPSLTAGGRHQFVRDGNDLVVVDPERRTLRLPLTGIDLFPAGREHQTAVVSTGPIDLGRGNGYPVEITVRHEGEDKTIRWSDPGVPAVVRHGRLGATP